MTRTGSDSSRVPPPDPPSPPSAGSGADAPASLRERYEVLGELGRGAMGAVYRARERVSGREVALKLILGPMNPVRQARFLREGRITASLRHPGIVRVHDLGYAAEGPFLVYELVEGARTLEETWDAATADPEAAPAARAARVLEVARALAHAHAAGVVHRDLKPANVLVDAEGRVRVADFGLAVTEEVERLTRSGALVGTPAYMAPEQLKGERARIGPASDVWALGVLLYEALVDAHPFPAAGRVELFHMVLEGRARVPRAARVAPALEAVVHRALAREPGARFADAGRFADALDEALRRPRPRRTRATLAAGALGLAALVGAAVRFATRDGSGTAVAPTLAGSSGAGANVDGVSAPAADGAQDGASRAGSGADLPAGLRPGAAPGEAINERDGSVLVWVPAARLRLGSERGEGDERSTRTVSFSRGWWIGKHEVTRRQYHAFCEATGREAPAGPADPEHPITDVSYADAQAYCRWAGLRLPSEAEWERAARGDDAERAFPWGAASRAGRPGDERRANLGHADEEDPPRGEAEDGFERTAPVGSFPAGASPFGCLDQAGNVWEWVADWYSLSYRDTRRLDPAGPRTGFLGVVRGGGWGHRRESARASNRLPLHPDQRRPDVGFRVARSPGPAPALAWVASERPPGPVAGMGIARVGSRVHVVGGTPGLFGMGNHWAFEGGRWFELTAPGGRVPARRRHGLAWDPRREVLVLSGGEGSGPRPRQFADVWEWDGETWRELDPPLPHPEPRSGQAMTWEPAHGRVVQFGGDMAAKGAVTQELWGWDGRAWSARIDLRLAPSPREEPGLGTDARAGLVVLFGGSAGARGLLGDTWTWDGLRWRELQPLTAPSPRRGHAMTWDPARERLLVFGGHDGRRLLDDLWAWDGERWRELPTQPGPTPRRLAGLACFADGRVLLVGGYGRPQGGEERALDDAWLLTPR